MALLVAHLHRYDAIAVDLHGLRSYFLNKGIECKIFASSTDPGVEACALEEVGGFLKSSGDGILLSYAGSWQKGELLFKKTFARKFLRYHNVTPPEFFETYDPLTANMCRLGRLGLAKIISQNSIDLYLPDSDFNALDLVESGASSDRIKKLPVFNQIDDLLRYENDLDPLILSLFFPGTPVVLMVGRIVPNKGYKNLILGFSKFKKYMQPRARLVLAGSTYPSFQGYYREIEQTLVLHGLENSVLMLSDLDARQLVTLYTRADVFAICSEHEGFCVPLVEAMALGTAVLALAKTAVSETLSSAGISWEQFDKDVWASSLNRIVVDRDLREMLAQKGKTRYEMEFSNRAVHKKLELIMSMAM